MFSAPHAEYAAPEQLSRAPITTATDVYALGIVLYELLVGRRPFESEMASPLDLQRLVLTTDPAAPSDVIRHALAVPAGNAMAIARSRKSTPVRLARRLRGDLDRVVLKALDANRNGATHRRGSWLKKSIAFWTAALSWLAPIRWRIA